MDRVGGQRLRTVPGSHDLHVRTLSDWLRSLDTTGASRKVRQEIEQLGPDVGGLSKASVKWSIDALLKVRDGRPDALIEMINVFEVQHLDVGKNRCVAVLAAVVMACPSLRGLCLRNAHVNDDEAEKLSSSLASGGHVSELTLKSCRMSDEAWRSVANALRHVPGLESLDVQAKVGPWLRDLGDGIARNSSLTSLKLSLSGLVGREAKLLGQALQGSGSLANLTFEVKAGCDVAESFMNGLVGPTARHLPHDPVPRLAKLSLVAHPVKPWGDSSCAVWFSTAFCDLLIRQIEARSALGGVRITPGIDVDGGRVRALEEVLRKHLVDFDIGAREASRPWMNIHLTRSLRRHLALRKYQSLVASVAAQKAAAAAWLSSFPVLDGSLPEDVTNQIATRMMGNDSLRQRWARHGWVQVNKRAYEAARKVRSRECVDSLVTSKGRIRDDMWSVDDHVRLQLSGIPLRDRDRARLSNAFSLSADCKYTRRAAKAFVREHMGLAKHLLKYRNPDGALFALEALQRVAKAYRLDEPRGVGILRARIALKR